MNTQDFITKLNGVASGRTAGKEVAQQWGEEFSVTETAAVLNEYIKFAKSANDYYSGFGSEDKQFLSNKFFAAIVNAMRPESDYSSDQRHGLRDRVWILLDSLKKIAAGEDEVYLKPWQTKSEAPITTPSKPAEAPRQAEAPTTTPARQAVPPNVPPIQESGFGLMPLAIIGLGIFAISKISGRGRR